MIFSIRKHFQSAKEELKFVGQAFATYTFGGILIVISPSFGGQEELLKTIGMTICATPMTMMLLRWWWGVKHDDPGTKQKLDGLTSEMKVLKEQNAALQDLLRQMHPTNNVP